MCSDWFYCNLNSTRLLYHTSIMLHRCGCLYLYRGRDSWLINVGHPGWCLHAASFPLWVEVFLQRLPAFVVALVQTLARLQPPLGDRHAEGRLEHERLRQNHRGKEITLDLLQRYSTIALDSRANLWNCCSKVFYMKRREIRSRCSTWSLLMTTRFWLSERSPLTEWLVKNLEYNRIFLIKHQFSASHTRVWECGVVNA